MSGLWSDLRKVGVLVLLFQFDLDVRQDVGSEWLKHSSRQREVKSADGVETLVVPLAAEAKVPCVTTRRDAYEYVSIVRTNSEQISWRPDAAEEFVESDVLFHDEGVSGNTVLTPIKVHPQLGKRIDVLEKSRDPAEGFG